MKKLFYLLFVAVLAVSCSNNENEVFTPIDIPEADLVGTWDVTAFNSDGEIAGSAAGQTIAGSYNSYGKNFDFKYVFTDSPKKVTASGSFTTVATVKVNGQSQTTEQPTSLVEGLGNGDWKEDNGVITITSNGVSDKAYVKSYENGVLVLKIDLNQSVDQQGVDFKIKGDLFITLKKK
ncbi:hypothetical protein WH52_01945 [Tenacibaculum holothuriorum]|uniref:Lipocalin-like domain-containing protein n=1 Tax=Tenacibaculum holothuriorum TaxID=1635173 RepID=A0A1Y2PGX5_9FLAO|nr:hypothetical protein [Tenacibaculum holothuriorum]OSY89420.1 hypothetical protein WH52_01945 [Tenacibaculum holothuriorum]